MTEVRAQVNEETNKGQLPWGHTNLIGSVYLNPAAGTGQPPQRPRLATVASTSGASEVELEFWRSVKAIEQAGRAQRLSDQPIPNGQFKSLALARIASLENGPSTTTRNLTAGVDPATFTEEANQTTEDQIGLDRGQRRDVQRRLTGLGFDAKDNGQVRRENPCRDRALAGGARLSQEWLSQRSCSTRRCWPKSSTTRQAPATILAATAAVAWRPAPRRGGGGGGGNPAAFIGGVVGGMVGGMFRR